LVGQLVGPVVAMLAQLGYRESYLRSEPFAPSLLKILKLRVDHVRAARIGNTTANIRAGVLNGSGGHSKGVVLAASRAASGTSRCRPASFRRGRTSPLRSSRHRGAQRVRCQRCCSSAVVCAHSCRIAKYARSSAGPCLSARAAVGRCLWGRRGSAQRERQSQCSVLRCAALRAGASPPGRAAGTIANRDTPEGQQWLARTVAASPSTPAPRPGRASQLAPQWGAVFGGAVAARSGSGSRSAQCCPRASAPCDPAARSTSAPASSGPSLPPSLGVSRRCHSEPSPSSGTGGDPASPGRGSRFVRSRASPLQSPA
jgi:hypothetical protein